MIDVRTILSLYLLLTFLLTLGPSLTCYECDSLATKIPICDHLYWKQLDKDEWAKLSVQCMENMSNFCIATWTRQGNGTVNIKRGCMGKTNSNGTRLHSGCFDTSITQKTCLCTLDLCNSSPTIFPSSVSILTHMSSILTAFACFDQTYCNKRYWG